ncbi:uncharacterized protein LOC113305579 [Papaver somniferum]|uniref:uncharacterized protein LOC113305579 n=1 Tax=Papaver somniferum TaxID=3469 RepID=UPI000E6F9FFB|nr:uncharacterized protein LOC113305579 [Papaver somniferum]
MVWVHYSGLSLEYWDEQTLFTIGKELGEPVKVDEATLNFENGLYARVLIKIDLAKKITKKLWIKTKFGGFMQSFLLTKLPKFCNHCKIVGHVQAECRVKTSSEVKSSNNHVQQRTATPNNKPAEKTNDKGKNSNIAPTPEAQKKQVKFDICFTPVTLISQHITLPQDQTILVTSGRFETLNTVVEEEEIYGIENLSPAKVQQIDDDNTVEKSVINFINGKDGSTSEERIPTTTWYKIIQKPSSSGTKTIPADQQKEVPNKNMVIHNSILNKKGNIWLFWNKHLPTPTVVSMSSQMITVNNGGNLVSGVHAHVEAVQRRILWSEMEVISGLNLPWISIGDFNAITTTEEKTGGRPANIKNMLKFNNFLDKCELQQAPKSGCEYTWSNCHHGTKRILYNLERAVVNNLWIQKHDDWSYKDGLRIASDHSPLLGGYELS